MIIKKAEINDATTIAEIEEKSFNTPWSLQQIKEELLHEQAYLLLALSETTIFGYVSIRINFDDIEILRIAVLPEFRRSGIAAKLIAETEKICSNTNKTSILLEVNESNAAAVHFYKKYGFVEYHRRKNYYNSNAALCMRKEIK
jgi:[ribosomal protein S18]-alanine N-acetyltransferase